MKPIHITLHPVSAFAGGLVVLLAFLTASALQTPRPGRVAVLPAKTGGPIKVQTVGTVDVDWPPHPRDMAFIIDSDVFAVDDPKTLLTVPPGKWLVITSVTSNDTDLRFEKVHAGQTTELPSPTFDPINQGVGVPFEPGSLLQGRNTGPGGSAFGYEIRGYFVDA